MYDKLVAKVNDTDTDGFVLKAMRQKNQIFKKKKKNQWCRKKNSRY